MIAILERWETRYGAELVANHGTMLQWIVANPPRTLEECWELTVEHELVAPDTFILPAVSMRERCSAVRRGGFTIDRSGREHRRNAGPPGRVKTARAPRQNYVRAAGVMASLLKPSPRRWRPNVAIAMARSGGHQLTDAILRSVALVAGTRVEVVRQTSTNAPVQTNSIAARPLSISGGVGWPGGYRGVSGAGLP